MEQQSIQTANNNDDGKKSPLTRRDFLKLGISSLSVLVIMEIGGAGLLYMKPRSLEGEFGGIVDAGAIDSFPLGSVVEFPNGRFFLIRTQEGGFMAVYKRCTHLGCSVSWEADKGQFFCPCHASAFDFHGNVENAPAPRALDTFPVTIEAGQVLVDTGRGQQRDEFHPDQLVFA